MRNLLILGSGRSGTSMVAGTLASSGWWVGERPYAAREANPKGFFETAEINGLNEELLRAALAPKGRLAPGQHWLAALPAGVEVQADEGQRARIAALVARSPWAFKDPRLCFTLPAWRAAAGDARLVCVFREPEITAQSIVKECASAEYLQGLAMDGARAEAHWCAAYERILEQHAAQGEWLFVHYDQMLTQAGLDRLERFAGAPLARNFPEASLKRSRGAAPASAQARELYERLCERAGHKASPRTQVSLAGAVPEISVILCTYDRQPILERALASFEAQDAPAGSFELIVVDDGSRDGTREFLDARAFTVPAQVIHQKNGGLASARNAGIARARGRWLLLVNDDTLAFPDLVREHLRLQRAEEAAGRASAVLGTFEQPLANLRTALMRHLERSGEVFRYADMVSGERYDHNRFWTCNVSVRTELVRELGGFDEQFRQYGCEDIDLGWRLEQNGVRVLYHAGARAHHEHVLDFAAFEKRQRTCAHSFVRLFHKHPGTLENPDWRWLRGRTLADLQRTLAETRARRAALEPAARALAALDLTALEEAGQAELATQAQTTLATLLGELNAHWWQAGFAQGLEEFGCQGFDALRARAPALVGRTSLLPHALNEAWARLESLRAQANLGETVLATLAAVRLGAELARVAEPSQELCSLQADLLNDLAVLRHQADDRRGALGALARALVLVPGHELALANQTDLSALPPSAPYEGEKAAPTDLSPWVKDALQLARDSAGLAGKDVLEVGGAVPPANALATGAKSWKAFYLGAEAHTQGAYERFDGDARSIPLPDASCDVIFSSCAFEHIRDFERAAAEMARVLRPGGKLATAFAPIWSYAVGHHLWTTDDQGGRVMFLDPYVPLFAHLLLTPDEMRWFLTLGLGQATAERCVHSIYRHEHINRVCEGEFWGLFEAAGFGTSGLQHHGVWNPAHVPSPALREELLRHHPQGGEFGAPGFRGVLVKGEAPRKRAPKKAAKPGRTIFIGLGVS